MNRTDRIVAAGLVVGVVVGGYFLVQSAQVRELLFAREQPRQRLAPVRLTVPEPSPPTPARPTVSTSPAASPSVRERPRTRSETPPPPPPVQNQNQVENQQLARILLQIMAARGLASGISLTVTDNTIEVNGETTSLENRRAILEILENGRASRQIIADHFTVPEW